MPVKLPTVLPGIRPVRLLPVLLLVLACQLPLHSQVYIRNAADQPSSGNIVKKEKSLQFIAMGDWGRAGADHQKAVAQQMAKVAAATGAQFIVSTGDNFYPGGVMSEWDPQFRSSFEEVYADFALYKDWYVVLGNHDYITNPDAEVAYSKISRRWKMPARYYAKKFNINNDSTQQLLLVFIDTNPLIPEFYKNSEYGPNVKTQDSAKQKAWMETLLADPSPDIKWKIVVGHHPMYSAGSRTNGYDTKAIRNSLEPLFEKYGVDLFLAGHEHSLQHIVVPGKKTQHFISGAASERTPVKLIPEAQMAASQYGFMLFSVTGKELLVQTIDYAGNLLYSKTLTKN